MSIYINTQLWNDYIMELVPDLPENIPENTRYHKILDFLSKTLRSTNIYLFGDITVRPEAENVISLHKNIESTDITAEPPYKKDF